MRSLEKEELTKLEQQLAEALELMKSVKAAAIEKASAIEKELAGILQQHRENRTTSFHRGRSWE